MDQVHSPSLAPTATRTVVGLFLLGISVLKVAYWQSGEMLVDQTWPTWLILLSWQMETIVGVWLVSRVVPTFSHVAAIVLFSLLAVFSGWAYWNGKESCGCFGQIQSPPIYSLLINVTVLGALAVTIRGADVLPINHWRTKKRIVFIGATAMTLLASLVMVRLMVEQHATSSRLRFEPTAIDLGTIDTAAPRLITLNVVNETQDAFNLLSIQNKSCRLHSGLHFPIGVSAFSTTELRLELSPPEKVGDYRLPIVLLTDSETSPFIRAYVRYRIAPTKS